MGGDTERTVNSNLNFGSGASPVPLNDLKKKREMFRNKKK